MTKVFKILGRVIGISFEWILITVIVFAFVIRTSAVQTFLAQKATVFLSSELDTKIRIDRVSIVFIDRVALDGVFVLDKNQDTLASIGRIYATLDELNLQKNYLKLENVELEKGTIHLNRAKTTGDYNYEFLTDYFSGKKRKTASKPFDVHLNNLKLADINLKYDDYRKYYSTFGMDYDHIDLRHIYLNVANFKTKKDGIALEILHLQAKEKSGFILEDFNGLAEVSGSGIKVKELRIQTPLSRIYAPKMYLLMHDFEDYQTFEDSVSFDSELKNCSVSMKDISYFATALEGMEQQVELSAVVTQKVKNLKISNLDLKTGKKTVLRGNLHLPDFREINKSFFNEKLNYAYISLEDLKKIKLPVGSTDQFLSFDTYLERLGNFQMADVRLNGFYTQFVLKADYIKTNLGTVKLDNGILFTENRSNGSYFFERSGASEYDVKIDDFQLGEFLQDKNFNTVKGQFFLSGEAFSLADIRFDVIEGNLENFDYLGYSYSHIFISAGSFIDNKINAKIEVKDDNLKLVYDGFIDFNGNQHMQFSVDLSKAILTNLNITTSDSSSLTSKFKVNIFGKSANNMFGEITMDGILYKEGNREVKIPSLKIEVLRGKLEDEFWINSDMATVNLRGKIDFSTLVSDFNDQFQKVFPSIAETNTAKKKTKKAPSHFSYSITSNRLNDFLSIFAPDLQVAPNTTLKGNYDGRIEDFSMVLLSPEIIYQDLRFQGVNLIQNLNSTSISANYNLQKFIYNDSIALDKVFFSTTGQQNRLNSELSWNQNGTNNSLIVWETNIESFNKLNFRLRPSYFSINEQRWEIENESFLSLAENKIEIEKFKVQRNNQFVAIDGLISRNDADKLNFIINEINLEELGSLIGSDVKMDGKMNAWGYLSNPYSNFSYVGDATLKNLHLNNQEVGDIYLQSQWNRGNQSVGLTGELLYRGNQTFDFEGSYFTDRKEDNLDFNLVFDQTDLKFTNAFMDPDVVNNIKGLLDGRLKVTGSPEFPKLEGDVELIGGNAKIEVLGVNFGLDGKISADEYGFYIDNMPVTDEEGNSGMMVGSIYHNKFKDWNFDLQFDLENSLSSYQSPLFATGYKNTEKFLVLNTKYKEGEYYNGRAFVTGSANIFGYADNVEITVDLQTKKGTNINFPMYGAGELSEEESFISFKKKGEDQYTLEPAKIDFTGVDLNLNFRVTPEAKLKIIFNEQLGDEITASGSGNISIKLDNLGDLTMDGTYRVKEGMYNFAMGPIKQPFHIQEGGAITWTGDPYTATLDIKTYYEVNANLSEISPDKLQGNGTGSNQKVLCYLGLTESLMKPTIAFDIKVPKADESGKALLARITGEEDELNRQFFSLLLWKRFQPLKGSTSVGGSAAMDLVSNQINSMLSQVSKDYKLNVNLDADNLTGENTMALGVSKGFLDDRLIFTGSFGVENYAESSQQTQSAFIGDVSLEYLLNESGTVRITVFNESNDYSIIQDKNLGLFTQGAGLNYQENFSDFENFKFAQYVLDVFRKRESKKFPVKRKKRQTPVPPKKEVVLPK